MQTRLFDFVRRTHSGVKICRPRRFDRLKGMLLDFLPDSLDIYGYYRRKAALVHPHDFAVKRRQCDEMSHASFSSLNFASKPMRKRANFHVLFNVLKFKANSLLYHL